MGRLAAGLIILHLMAILLTGSAWAQDNGDNENDEPWTPPIDFSGGGSTTTIQAPVAETLPYADQLMGSVISPPRPIDDFTMPATTGEDFVFSDQQGKILMVYFGYMTCPEVCPTTMADMLRAYREVGEPRENVRVLFITIDPERDTLDRMTAYVNAFHEDFIGLRPDSQEVLDAAMHNFGVIAQRREVDSALGYLWDHSATVFLVAPDGRLVSQLPYGVSYTEIANDLQVLLDNTLSSGIVTAPPLMGDADPDHDADREFRIVIPYGTAAQIRMGQDPGVIPLKINLTLGVQDILVLENHDDSDFLVGGIWVAPHETVSKQFYQVQSFVGLCTVTVGNDLVEIIVSEPETTP
jgi:protein SCO1/2